MSKRPNSWANAAACSPRAIASGRRSASARVGAEDGDIGVRGLTTLFEPPQQLRRFCPNACAVSGPSCRDQQWVGVETCQTVQGIHSTVVGISRSAGQGEGFDSLDQHFLCRFRQGTGQGMSFDQIALGDI